MDQSDENSMKKQNQSDSWEKPTILGLHCLQKISQIDTYTWNMYNILEAEALSEYLHNMNVCILVFHWFYQCSTFPYRAALVNVNIPSLGKGPNWLPFFFSLLLCVNSNYISRASQGNQQTTKNLHYCTIEKGKK